MGQLANASNVSKRTIDYYTRIGLLTCERSDTNYRLYNQKAVEEIRFIEKCKKMNMTLEQIKEKKWLLKLEEIDKNTTLAQADQITKKMSDLKEEIKEIHAMFEKMETQDQITVLKNIKPQTVALIQALILFSS
nr:MerR family transcriptional regulator [Gracilibacillus kekensis]